MVRLKLSFINGKGEWLSTHAQTFDCDSMSAWTSKIRPGGWYELWSFDLGDSSVALGIGFMEPSCKVNMNRGFVEFNPNKVAGDKRFWRLLEKLAPCVSHASLKRYDLAYDIECARKDCRLSKDRRMYKAVISNGITEYLGVKNTPGYVKVYDKAAEMQRLAPELDGLAAEARDMKASERTLDTDRSRGGEQSRSETLGGDAIG